jgi:plasmid maintenance system antidote protein VapI
MSEYSAKQPPRAGFWLRMQTAHDLWHAERKLRDEIQKIPEHAAA